MPAPTQNKGLLILSMPRAGSSWLASFTNATGTMGKADEWLDFGHLTAEKGSKGRPELNAKILRSASTENGNFAVKIFPRQLLQVVDEYEYDFIRRARREHNTSVVVLEREDRIAQAISLVRAMQSGQWSASQFPTKPVHYNFGALCQAYFHINRGYAFWHSYLGLGNIPHTVFTYETLLQNPQPYLEHVSGFMGLPLPATSTGQLTIQRDETSVEWREKFAQDIEQFGIPASTYQQKQPEPTLENALNVLRGNPAKISRFGYSV